MTVAGGVLSPLELCDVNGDGLPDILVVFTALMNASVRGKHRSSFPFLFLYMSLQTFVCLMHGNSSCLCKSTSLLFSEFLKMADVLCLCFVTLLIIFIASLCSHTCWVNIICFPLFLIGASPSFSPVFVHTWLMVRDIAIRKDCSTNSNWK